MVKWRHKITKGEHLKLSNKLIYSGKAKDILATDDEDVIVAHYKDQATAFNGVKKEQIVGKGVLNNQISSFIFEKIECCRCSHALYWKDFRYRSTLTKK